MVNLTMIANIWGRIVESNTFNFVIFVLILAWVFKKINISAVISSLQEKILKIIDEAKKNHEDAKLELKQAESSVANLETELKTLVEDASKSANVIGEKIINEAKKQVQNIENTAEKIITAEEKMLISKLTKTTSQESIAAAKSHIQQVLEQTPTLHEKYINESIDELDRLNF